MITIRQVFEKYTRYYLAKRNKLRGRLKALPAKGSIIAKRIKGHDYFYLEYRDRGRICWDYIGKREPEGLRQQIAQRRQILKDLRGVEEALYALGAARRIGSIGPSRRFQVFSRDDFTCQYCGRNVKQHKIVLVVDHIHPKKRGGSDNIRNLITACEECNAGKHKHLLGTSLP
jgi:5-methylcytosine-specific restriction endonuclease McrA